MTLFSEHVMYNDTGITIAYMIDKYYKHKCQHSRPAECTNKPKNVHRQAQKKPQNITGGHNTQVMSNTT